MKFIKYGKLFIIANKKGITITSLIKWLKQDLYKRQQELCEEFPEYSTEMLYQDIPNYDEYGPYNGTIKNSKERCNKIIKNDKLSNDFKMWYLFRTQEIIMSRFKRTVMGKQGIWRRHIEGKDIKKSARAVIVPGGIDIPLNKIGIPKVICQYLEIDENDWVLIKRDPVIDPTSTQAFQAIPVDGYAVKFPNLACAGFNADFDGDTVAIFKIPEYWKRSTISQLAMNSLIVRYPESYKLTTDYLVGAYLLNFDLSKWNTLSIPDKNMISKKFLEAATKEIISPDLTNKESIIIKSGAKSWNENIDKFWNMTKEKNIELYHEALLSLYIGKVNIPRQGYLYRKLILSLYDLKYSNNILYIDDKYLALYGQKQKPYHNNLGYIIAQELSAPLTQLALDAKHMSLKEITNSPIDTIEELFNYHIKYWDLSEEEYTDKIYVTYLESGFNVNKYWINILVKVILFYKAGIQKIPHLKLNIRNSFRYQNVETLAHLIDGTTEIIPLSDPKKIKTEHTNKTNLITTSIFEQKALSKIPYWENNNPHRLIIAVKQLKQNLKQTKLKVGYFCYLGFTYEDGAVISKSAAKKLDIDYYVHVKVPLNMNIINYHTLMGDTIIWNDTIIAYSADDEEKKEIKIKATHRECGLVVKTVKEDGYLIITIKSHRPLMIGDKISNLHANKATISLILDDDKMPHNVDLILNPFSTFSRQNLGQFKESEIDLKDKLYIGSQTIMRLDHNALDKIKLLPQRAGELLNWNLNALELYPFNYKEKKLLHKLKNIKEGKTDKLKGIFLRVYHELKFAGLI